MHPKPNRTRTNRSTSHVPSEGTGREGAPSTRTYGNAPPTTARHNCTRAGRVLYSTAQEQHMRGTLETTWRITYAQNAATVKRARQGERKQGKRTEVNRSHPPHRCGGPTKPPPKTLRRKNGRDRRVTGKQRRRQRHIHAKPGTAVVRKLTNQQNRSRRPRQRRKATTMTGRYGSSTYRPTLNANGAHSKTTKINAHSSPAHARFGTRTYYT